MLVSVGNRLLKPMLAGRAAGGQLKQLRNLHPIIGPPKYPLTTGEVWYLGVGMVVACMIVPMWGLFSVPAWVEEHNRVD